MLQDAAMCLIANKVTFYLYHTELEKQQKKTNNNKTNKQTKKPQPAMLCTQQDQIKLALPSLS